MPCIEDYNTKTREELMLKHHNICRLMGEMNSFFHASNKINKFLGKSIKPSDKYENLVNEATELLCSWVREVGIDNVKNVASSQLLNWVNAHIKQDQKRTEDCKNALVALAKGYGFDLDIASVKLK